MHCYGAILLLIGLGLLAGCPRPINQEGPDTQASAEYGTSGAETEAGDLQTDRQLDAGVIEEDEAAAKSAGTAAAASAPDEAAPAEDAGNGETATAGPATEADRGVTFPGRKRGQEIATKTGEEADLLDPATMLGDAADQPVTRPEPPTPLDRAARAFSGHWTVIVVNQDGHSRVAESDDEWLFKLADDGSCAVSRNLAGKTSEQSGSWELKDNQLTLRMGPARRAYSIEQPRENVALFSDATAGAMLFCVRLIPGERAPQLQASYELGGSELRFRSAGPGGYWRGTVTEPECSLLVHPVGKFVAGTWETAQDDGYVLLELTKDGFDGWWWYSESIAFDGVWRSGAE